MWTAKKGGLLIKNLLKQKFFRLIHGQKILTFQEKMTTLARPHPYFSGKNDQNEPFLSTDGSPIPLPVRLNQGLTEARTSGTGKPC